MSLLQGTIDMKGVNKNHTHKHVFKKDQDIRTILQSLGDTTDETLQNARIVPGEPSQNIGQEVQLTNNTAKSKASHHKKGKSPKEQIADSFDIPDIIATLKAKYKSNPALLKYILELIIGKSQEAQALMVRVTVYQVKQSEIQPMDSTSDSEDRQIDSVTSALKAE